MRFPSPDIFASGSEGNLTIFLNMPESLIYAVIGFLVALVIMLGWMVVRSINSQNRKDEIIHEFGRSVTPLLKEMLQLQKMYSESQAERDIELKKSIDRFASVVQKLVTMISTISYIRDVKDPEPDS